MDMALAAFFVFATADNSRLSRAVRGTPHFQTFMTPLDILIMAAG